MIERPHNTGRKLPLPSMERHQIAIFAGKNQNAHHDRQARGRGMNGFRERCSRIVLISVIASSVIFSGQIRSDAKEKRFADLAIGETAYAWMEDLCLVTMKRQNATTPVLKSNNKLRSGPPRNKPYALVYGAKDGAYLMIHPPVGSTNPTDVIFAHSTFTSAPDKACSKRDAPIPTLFGMKGHSRFNKNVSVKEAWQSGR